jgi:lysophospholipase L1-like esterase
MIRRLLCGFFAAALAVAMLTAPVAAKSKHGHKHAPVHYLALGTSLAFGIQARQVDESVCINVPSDVSYPKLLAQTISKKVKNLELVNISCPGETSDTFIDGGICNYAQESQLEAAVAFLRAHRKSTRLITIDLGANDALACVDDATLAIDFQCLLDTVDRLESNLEMVLGALRKAAPGVPIVGMNYYNPLLLIWSVDRNKAALTALLQELVNLTLERVYTAFKIPVADVSGAFMSADLHTDDIGTELPDSVDLLIAWTWMYTCNDIHPNDVGYGVIAEEFAAVLPKIRSYKPHGPRHGYRH